MATERCLKCLTGRIVADLGTNESSCLNCGWAGGPLPILGGRVRTCVCGNAFREEAELVAHLRTCGVSRNRGHVPPPESVRSNKVSIRPREAPYPDTKRGRIV